MQSRVALETGEVRPTSCAVFPISANANVYFEVRDYTQDAGNEVQRAKEKPPEAKENRTDIDSLKIKLSKTDGQIITEAMRSAMQSAESRKRDLEARLRALEEAVTIFEQMI